MAFHKKYRMETILDLAERLEGVPLDDEGFNDLIDAVNTLRGFRKELQLTKMRLGGKAGP